MAENTLSLTQDRHRNGLLLTFGGVLLISPDALILNFTDVDTATLIFWRGLLFLLGLLLIQHLRQPSKNISWRFPRQPAVIAASLAFTLTLACFPFAITHTSTANALVIASCTPLISALISYFAFSERVDRSTTLVILLCIAGVLVIMLNSPSQLALQGDIAAVGYAVGMAVMLSVLSHKPYATTGDQVFFNGALLAVLLTLPLMLYQADLQLQAILPYIPFGLLIFPLAMLCIKQGSAHIGAPEAGIILLSEAVFGPLWVYLVLGEIPSFITLITGLFIFLVIFFHSTWQLKQSANPLNPRS